jgi:hypothetical protein
MRFRDGRRAEEKAAAQSAATLQDSHTLGRQAGGQADRRTGGQTGKQAAQRSATAVASSTAPVRRAALAGFNHMQSPAKTRGSTWGAQK